MQTFITAIPAPCESKVKMKNKLKGANEKGEVRQRVKSYIVGISFILT